MRSAGSPCWPPACCTARRRSRPIEPLRAVSAFKYYGSAIQDGLDPLAFAGLAFVGTLLATAGAFLFDRRDVR